MANPIDSDWVDVADQSSDSDWQDVDPRQQSIGHNAISDVKDIASSIPSAAGQLAMLPKKLLFDMPNDIYQTGKQMVQGQPFSQTPVGQQAGQLKQMGSDFVDTAKNYVEHPIQSFQEHPIKMPLNVIGTVAPVAGAAYDSIAAPILRGAQSRIVPPLLKSTKGIPAEASKMALRNPDVLDLPGTSESIQGKSQGIINAIKDAGKKVGQDFGDEYANANIENPVDQIINGKTSYRPILNNKSYRESSEYKTEFKNAGGQTSGEYTSDPIMGGSYKEGKSGNGLVGHTQEIPGELKSYKEPVETVSQPFQQKSFDELRNDYQSAINGDLFKKRGIAGGYSQSNDLEKLSTLTELKRALQNEAIYPQPGQQLSPSQGARNAAIKQMANQIDQLRGKVPGGNKLAAADDAWSEMNELKHRLMSAFRDPYTGQDYLNRILKGNTDWLTSGRNAGKVGAIQRVEQISGKQVLKPALEEMAAAYIKNPDTMGLPSTGLKSIITSLVPAKAFLKPIPSAKPLFRGGFALAPAVGDQSAAASQENSQSPSQSTNDNGNEQNNQNSNAGNSESLGNHPRIIQAGKTLTKEIAKKFMAMANGSKELAREFARKEGYSW